LNCISCWAMWMVMKKLNRFGIAPFCKQGRHLCIFQCWIVCLYAQKFMLKKHKVFRWTPFLLDTISFSFLHGFKPSKWYGYANMSSTQSLWTLDTKRKANGFKLFESLNVQWMDCLLYLYSSFAQSINELYCDLYNDI